MSLINQARASAGLPAYSFNGTESSGTGTCVGSYGHSVHMATVGVISHDQFPADICVSYRAAGENVGVAGTGNMQNDIQTVFNIMMGEPHDPTTCATTANHACNILSKTFTQAGIGIYYASGSTWITEDFIG